MRNSAIGLALALALSFALSACASRTAAVINGVVAAGFTTLAIASGDCDDECIVDGRGIAAIPATGFAIAALACWVAASHSPATPPRKPTARR